MKYIFLLTITMLFATANAQQTFKLNHAWESCSLCEQTKGHYYTVKNEDLIKNKDLKDFALIYKSRKNGGNYLFGTDADKDCPQSNSGNHSWRTYSEILTISVTKNDLQDFIKLRDVGQANKENNKENNKEKIDQKPELFSGEGTVTYYNGDKYLGPIIDGKPNGEGKLISEYYNGYILCLMIKGEIQRWKYIRESNDKQITTEMSYGTSFTCKINNESVLNGDFKGSRVEGGTINFQSGNKLWFKIKDNSIFNYDYEVSKIFSDGTRIKSEIINGNFLPSLSSIRIGPVQIPIVISQYPEEVYINGRGKMYLKDETIIIGNFKNDSISENKCEIKFPNGNSYSGEIQYYEGMVNMHGQGVLNIKGKQKPQVGYWKYNQYIGRKKKD